jgi:hypothetical protein
LVDLVSPTFDGSITISGFPAGAASIGDDKIVTGTSVKLSSLNRLAQFTLTHTDSQDYTLRISNGSGKSLPVLVLPVASKPTLQAPPEPIVNVISISVGRTDPAETLSVELRVGTDENGVLLGAISTAIEVPGVTIQDQGNGVYRIASTSTDSTPAAVESAINRLLDGNLSFIANEQAAPGKYAEGLHVIVTSTDTDEAEGQIATASVAVFLPVLAGSDSSISLVEDVPKAIGSDIAQQVEFLLSSSSTGFQVAGFSIDSTISFTQNGQVRTITIQEPDVAFDFANLAELRTLVVTAPPQSDEDFTLTVVTQGPDATTLDLPVSVLAVADRPSVRVISPVVSRDGKSVPIQVYPEIGDDRDGSESLAVTFQVLANNSALIGTLALVSKVEIPGATFTDLGGGLYRLEVIRSNPVIAAAALRLLLVSGSVLFTPNLGLRGDFAEGVKVTVVSSEKAGTCEGSGFCKRV